MLRDSRKRRRLRQQDVADSAGLSRTAVVAMEGGGGASFSLVVWVRASGAAGAGLRAYLEQASAADEPRDVTHLRGQELVVRTARPGGWRGRPEVRFDRDPERSRSADVLLERPGEVALFEVFDWLGDVGGEFRAWDRRLARVDQWSAGRTRPEDEPLPRVGGCWVLRATRRNRELVGEFRSLFAARFPGSAVAWLRALSDPTSRMPQDPALIWISVGGDRLWPARLG
jgi:hypothetical protein